MATFTVRVVLHNNATWDDYSVLHRAMGERGLIDVITATSGKRYRLPPAEYFGEGPITAIRCREIAEEAAKTTGKPFAILVTEGGQYWVGLEEVV